jgi:capsule polysaccharide export protein KpsE/RkpR
MSEEQKKAEDNMEEEEGINLLDYLIILAKRKKLILKITLSVAIITFILTFFKASFYQAQISILPPEQQDTRLANQFMREFGVFPTIGTNVIGKQDLLVEIIKSRTFTDRIIERFRLKESYGSEGMEKTRKKFSENITIEPDFTNKSPLSFRGVQSPLMKIFVRDKNPERATNIANAIVEELQKFINNIAISEASQRRLFFEEQLRQAREALIKAEDDIKTFQEKTGLLKVETQTAMTIEKVANLQAQITAKEIDLQVMRSYSTVSNPDVQKVEETIKVLKNELAKLGANTNYGKNSIIPTGTIPSLGLEYQRKFRELKFNETLYDILAKQYESAKIDEAKDAFLIQIIDKAVPPDKETTVRKFGLKKALATTSFAFFFSCFLAFFMEYREKATKNERLETLKGYLSFKNKT